VGSTAPRHDIANEAKVALGLIYAHFDSKDAVLTALLDASILDVGHTLRAAERARTAEEFVSQLLEAAVPLLDAHRDRWRLSYALRHQPDALASSAPPIDRFTAATLKRLEQALATRGVPNARIEAAVLFALIDGIAQQYVELQHTYPIRDVIRAAAARYRPFRQGSAVKQRKRS
jgi:AcrR family transcriptional regulator